MPGKGVVVGIHYVIFLVKVLWRVVIASQWLGQMMLELLQVSYLDLASACYFGLHLLRETSFNRPSRVKRVTLGPQRGTNLGILTRLLSH